MLTLVVGPERTVTSLPADLLLRRSPYFYVINSHAASQQAPRSIEVPDISMPVFRHLYLWLMDPHPRLDKALSLDLPVDLAVFSTQHELPALLHQCLDRLRQKFGSDNAAWTPPLLDRIYSHTPEDCLLRTFTQAALSTLAGASWHSVDKTAQKLAPWSALFERHADLGRDFFLARVHSASTHALTAVRDDHCRFHRHRLIQSSTPASVGWQTSCPRLEHEPFEDQTVGLQRPASLPNLPLIEDTTSPKLSKKQKKKKLRRGEASLAVGGQDASAAPENIPSQQDDTSQLGDGQEQDQEHVTDNEGEDALHE